MGLLWHVPKMSDKYLGRYIGEFAGRHNARPVDTLDQMELMAHGMMGKRLTFQELVSVLYLCILFI